MRLYHEWAAQKAAQPNPPFVTVPVSVSIFPNDIRRWPRSWAERSLAIVDWEVLEAGGHFGSWEQPELFTDAVRRHLGSASIGDHRPMPVVRIADPADDRARGLRRTDRRRLAHAAGAGQGAVHGGELVGHPSCRRGRAPAALLPHGGEVARRPGRRAGSGRCGRARGRPGVPRVAGRAAGDHRVHDAPRRPGRDAPAGTRHGGGPAVSVVARGRWSHRGARTSSTTPTWARSSGRSPRPRCRRRARDPALRRPAVPAQRPGVDGHGLPGAVDPARSWPADLDVLREHGFHVAALALTPTPSPSTSSPPIRPTGSPSCSARRATASPLAPCPAVDRHVRIPMSGGVDSLNVAAASAVALWALRAPASDRAEEPVEGAVAELA